MEADPDLCGAFQLEKQLLCVRRAGTGTEETELCSRFSVGASEESEAASFCTWCLLCEREGLGLITISPWPLPVLDKGG